ncbi:dockerin type I domain-containing protein, partial [Stieleria sp. TO1_6]|uniref:dockerin type I domain-containing protein n=1 Tax=Stieleria tagensis TaxID=2956795 RepID=UPI00209AF777
MGKPSWLWNWNRLLGFTSFGISVRRIRWQPSSTKRNLRAERLVARQMLAADTGNLGSSIEDSEASNSSGLQADVNSDGAVTPVDALIIVNAINDGLTADQRPAADLSGDDQIDHDDFLLATAALDKAMLEMHTSDASHPPCELWDPPFPPPQEWIDACNDGIDPTTPTPTPT